MGEPTADDKIQQLVKAVLEAVDARLDGVRQEMAQFAADANRRHQDASDAIVALQRQVDELSARPARDADETGVGLNERMARATKILAERMEAAQRDAVLATERRLAQLTEQVDALQRSSHQPTPPPPTEMAAISRPLFDHAHITGPAPIVSDTARVRQMTAPPMPPIVPTTIAPPVNTAAAALTAHEEIDIDRLTSLINEKLEHFTLPQRPE
jgi:hypothetical protein